MRRDINYRRYDPQNFAQDHPYDTKLREALEGANSLASQTQGQQAGESLTDARDSADENFNNYSLRFDRDLDQFHKGELNQQKSDYFEQQRSLINERLRQNVDNAKNQQELEGSQGAHSDSIKNLEKSYENNFADRPDYLEQRSQLENFQGARSEAISHGIGKIQDQTIEDKGLNGPDTPPSTTPPDAPSSPDDIDSGAGGPTLDGSGPEPPDASGPGDTTPDDPDPDLPQSNLNSPTVETPSDPTPTQPADLGLSAPGDPDLMPPGDPSPEPVEAPPMEVAPTSEPNVPPESAPTELSAAEYTSEDFPSEPEPAQPSEAEMQQSPEYQQFLESYNSVAEPQPAGPEMNQDQAPDQSMSM